MAFFFCHVLCFYYAKLGFCRNSDNYHFQELAACMRALHCSGIAAGHLQVHSNVTGGQYSVASVMSQVGSTLWRVIQERER